MCENNPDLQIKVIKTGVSHSDIALNDEIPTLGLIRRTYGEEIAIEWLSIQFGSMNDYAEQGVGIREDQIKELSELFLSEYYYINLLEVCFFIARLKLGKYGQFYGAIGPMKIMSSMCEYIRERKNDMKQYERKKKREEDQNRINQYSEKCITYEEYVKQKNNKITKKH